MPKTKDRFVQNVFELLDAGVIEAWEGEDGLLRFYPGIEAQPEGQRVDALSQIPRVLPFNGKRGAT